ncbi:hypothetical protein ABZ840_06950 [Streptomyces sp. NPDC047117]|uniref:Dyp-type peroxidase n=1 Tax=Streptomyces sp. NPDC047117 TaxID=3155379 RepID=UPI0033D9366B
MTTATTPSVPAARAATDTALPLRRSTQVQGDILAGFRKDHTTVLFLHFSDPVKARQWLKELVPRIATVAQVTAFNEEFSSHRSAAGGQDPDHLKVTWLNFGVTHPGLQLFTGKEQIFDKVPPESTLDAYVQGAAARAEIVGDVDVNAPSKWLYGNGQPVHGVLTLASDDDEELIHVIELQKEAIGKAGGVVVYHQKGATLPGNLTGKDHFGFKDGVSQPGVAGYDEEDPENPGYVKGKPGTKLLPAGEFLIGYDRLSTGNPRTSYPADAMPAWMKDGSFHVVRRMAQDVPGWWGQVEQVLDQLKKAGAVPPETNAEWMGARMVGRWGSGASLIKCPMKPPSDDQDTEPDNDFDFADDPDGLVTPLYSHTRKSAPRAGLVNDGKKVDALLNEGRRIIRRGSPYGKPFSPDGSVGSAADDPRGMAFGCYQADIVGQFEFIQRKWTNNSDNPQNRKPPAGPDAMISGKLTPVTDGRIGHESTNAQGTRMSTPVQLTTFVLTQGCVYSFAPSMNTLRRLTEGRLDGDVPDIPSLHPHGARINAMLPVPGEPSRYWSFQGPLARPVTDARGERTTDLLAGSTAPVSSWPALASGVDKVDTILPMPDQTGTDGKDGYWVFHTVAGAQVYRNMAIGGTPPVSSSDGQDKPLSRWNSLGGVTHVDAFMKVPDVATDAEQQSYWLFHTTPGGQKYRMIKIQAYGGHGDEKVYDDSPLTSWPSLQGISQVDAIQPVPGKQRENGESWYWVFHKDSYRVIGVADGSSHADRVIQNDRPFHEWNSPS